jgi:hypothetical protein
LKPILSRFCEIYIPEPIFKKKKINLYKYIVEKTFHLNEVKTKRILWLKKELQKPFPTSPAELLLFSKKLYERGYSGMDFIHLLENKLLPLENITEEKRLELLFTFNRVRKEFRNEKMLMFFMMQFIFVSSNVNLENISFI